MIEPVSDNILNLVNDLYNNLDAKDKIINDQALEIVRLKETIDKARECIKNRNTTKSKKERFMSGETTLEKVLEILGDNNGK